MPQAARPGGPPRLLHRQALSVEILDDKGDNRLTLMACNPKYSARSASWWRPRWSGTRRPPPPGRRRAATAPETPGRVGLAGGDPSARPGHRLLAARPRDLVRWPGTSPTAACTAGGGSCPTSWRCPSSPWRSTPPSRTSPSCCPGRTEVARTTRRRPARSAAFAVARRAGAAVSVPSAALLGQRRNDDAATTTDDRPRRDHDHHRGAAVGGQGVLVLRAGGGRLLRRARRSDKAPTIYLKLDCALPHQDEVFATFDYTGQGLPGAAGARVPGQAACPPRGRPTWATLRDLGLRDRLLPARRERLGQRDAPRHRLPGRGPGRPSGWPASAKGTGASSRRGQVPREDGGPALTGRRPGPPAGRRWPRPPRTRPR